MKYSDTNPGVPSAPKHSCVIVPLSRYRTPRLPTLPLSFTNSDAVSIPSRCLLSVISSPSFYPPRFRHSLYERMAAAEIRAKQSQRSREHLFASLALVLHFTFDFSVSVGGAPLRAVSVWRVARLSKCPRRIENTAYATDAASRRDERRSYSWTPERRVRGTGMTTVPPPQSSAQKFEIL